MPENQFLNSSPLYYGMAQLRRYKECQCGGVATRLTADQLQPGSNPGIGFWSGVSPPRQQKVV